MSMLTPRAELNEDPVLEARGLSVLVGGRRRLLGRSVPPTRAVTDLDLQLTRNEILGVVGESGCGKTTLGRTLLGLQRETKGEIRLGGNVVSNLPPQRARLARRAIQYVHQDAAAALDSWWSIGRSLEEALIIHGMKSSRERRQRVNSLLTAVGLDSSIRARYPHELSGGQLRRVAIARILLLEPRVVILDEPTSGLDLSVQATVLELLLELRQRLGISVLFISHDLSVVRQLCDRVAIMYLGRIVEVAPARDIFCNPLHPYTRALLAAAPRLDGARCRTERQLTGEPSSPSTATPGCGFQNRCLHAEHACRESVPSLSVACEAHYVACRRWRDLLAASTKPLNSANAEPEAASEDVGTSEGASRA